MHIHKDLESTDQLALSNIAKKFVSVNERHKSYFGSWVIFDKETVNCP